MSTTAIGMAVGAVLALTWIEYGFWEFVGVAIAITIGAVVARVVEGRLDLRSVAEALRGTRSSS